MEEYYADQVIQHPIHGECTVTFVGTDYIGVVFGGSEHALLRRESFDPSSDGFKAFYNASDDSDRSHLPWPDSTFLAEPLDARHFMGSHWDPFFDDVKDVMNQLPEIMPDAVLLAGYGEFYKAPREIPTDWPRGVHLVWPNPDRGLVITIKPGEETHQIINIYPLYSRGVQVPLRINRVIVMDGGLEAQIEAQWGQSDITFFDTVFLVNRAWYVAGETYEFILSAIAYSARVAADTDMPVSLHPDQIAWEAMLARQRGEAPQEPPARMSLSGTTLLLPVPEWDVDDYSFRGPIKSVQPVEDMLGQSGWRVRVTVMRFGDQDADLDILVTERVWSGSEPPAVGQEIEGQLWLQGRLWSVGTN